MTVFERLGLYLSYPFVRYALLVGVLIALCSSLFGTTLVLKRLSFMGDGLSHVAFGAMAVAMVLGVSAPMWIVLPITAVCAVLLLGVGKRSPARGDATVAMLSVGALALGYLLLHFFPSASGNLAADVCGSLFGSTSILTLSKGEVWLSVALCATVVLVFLWLYNRLFALTFDETFARASGLAADRYHLVIALVVAVMIVLAMNLVGSLLISALVVFPTLSAMRLADTFRRVTVLSVILSTLSTAVGILASLLLSTPTGATVVAVDVLVYLVCLVAGKCLRRAS